MKIIFDGIIFELQKIGGISKLFENIFKNLKVNFKILLTNTKPKFNKFDQIFEDKSVLRRFKKVNLDKNYVFHSTYYRLSNSTNNIVSFYDFTHEIFKKNNPKTIILKKIKYNAAVKSKKIICISEHTKNDLLNIYGKEFEKKVSVVYPIISDSFLNNSPDENFNNDVIYIGSREKYKNFENTVQAVKKIKFLRLKIIGGGKLSIREKLYLKHHLPNRFVHLSYITDDQLKDEYNKSFCLVYCSYYEGFGMPIIEAMKSGCPVISRKGSSLTEVVGKSQFLLNEGNYKEIAEALEALNDNKIRYLEKKLNLDNIKRFDTSETIQKLENIYKNTDG